MEYYVYGHINPITKKFFYIGKGTGRRSTSAHNRNVFWKHTVAKYGCAVVKFVDGLSESEAFEVEKQYIQKFKLRRDGGCLVNLTYGGEGISGARFKLSEATKSKMSVSRMGMLLSNKTKEKISESRRGDKNPNYGKKTWNYGTPRTEAEKKKMSDSKIGIEQSEERKVKSRLALEKAHKVKVDMMLQVECLTTGIIWKNRNECIESLKITLSQFKDRIRIGRAEPKFRYIKKQN